MVATSTDTITAMATVSTDTGMATNMRITAVSTATDTGMATVMDTATATAARKGRRPYTPFANSRSLNFWILPVEVLGRSTNTTWRGHLKWAR